MNQRRAGALIRYVTIGTNSAIGILFVPFLLRTLGKTEYGLYELIGSLVGYLTILDFGIQSTVVRFVAKYRAEQDRIAEENFLAIIFSTYIAISIILCVIGSIIYCYLDKAFEQTLTTSEITKARILFVILVASLIVLFIGKTFSGIILARERFIFENLITFAQVLLKTGAWTIVLLMGHGSVALVTVSAIMNVMVVMLSIIYCVVELNVHIRLHRWNIALFREILSYSGFLFLMAVITQMNLRIGHFILGVMLGTSAVAIYAVAIQLVQIFCTIGCVIPNIMLPSTVNIVANGTKGKELSDFLVQPSRYQLIILMPIIIAFVLFGKDFISLWVGADYALSWHASVLIMAPVTCILLQELLINVLKANGLLRFYTIAMLTLTGAAVLTSVALVPRYGVMGVCYGTSLGFMFGNIVIYLYIHYRIGLNIPRFLAKQLDGLWLAFAVATIVGVAELKIPGGSWQLLIIRCALFTVVYAIAIAVVGMNATERAMVRAMGEQVYCYWKGRPQ